MPTAPSFDVPLRAAHAADDLVPAMSLAALLRPLSTTPAPATAGLEAEVRALREVMERAERREVQDEFLRLTAAFDAKRR